MKLSLLGMCLPGPELRAERNSDQYNPVQHGITKIIKTKTEINDKTLIIV